MAQTRTTALAEGGRRPSETARPAGGSRAPRRASGLGGGA